MNRDLSNHIVLVTGFDGFLGSELVAGLLGSGATVVGLQLRLQAKEPRGELGQHERFCVRPLGAETDRVLGDDRFRNHDRACFHFAGNASAGECQTNPRLAYESNVLLTYDVIDFCRVVGVRKFVFPSTGYVYGSRLQQPAKETDRLLSCNIYTSTKVAAESLLEGYANYHEMECKIGRVSNVYGRGSQTETVSGKIINSAIGRVKIELDSTEPIRDFIHMNDAIGAFLTILDAKDEEPCSYFNVSTGVATSIGELAETACKIASLPRDYVVSGDVGKYADTWLVLDNTKIRERTDWVPELSVEAGLRDIL